MIIRNRYKKRHWDVCTAQTNSYSNKAPFWDKIMQFFLKIVPTTPGTKLGPGDCDRMLAVDNRRKNRFSNYTYYILSFCLIMSYSYLYSDHVNFAQGLVGCIIGFDQKNQKNQNQNQNQNHKPVRTYLDHFQITLKADFRYATLLKPN